ncbi:hypothetical protein [Desmospora profundinema]|uniref:Phosphoglycerol transferase MdoB-like AlkP superfamily enzyme n=1 Tax=Desmospora profundinema TaxID=1571184 RepID=A0ABU1ILY2_9BACL|nr:hypothetical protein [Desmospora profundinema]MDR6224969.1 phosphoglycerol transferase MdoB-like AlkP superfamily enzyme [Desmospora profundinema]
MDSKRLGQLRKKQFVYSNGMVFGLFITYLLLIGALPSFETVMLLVAGSLAVMGITGFVKQAPVNALWVFPSMRELFHYEQEKMGPEWRKYHRVNAAGQVIVSLIFMLQTLLFSPVGTVSFLWDGRVIAILFLFLFVVVNVSMYFHVRKVDRSTRRGCEGLRNRPPCLPSCWGRCWVWG